MPTETRFVRPNHLTKEAAYVVPLDDLRSYDNVTLTVISGTSGILYTIASGKEGYLKQALFTELSGISGAGANFVQLKDPRGSGLTVPIPILNGNSMVTYDANDAIGPIQSGITVESPQFGGAITLAVQIDPKMVE